MPEENWPGDWMRGALELCALAVLAQHGPAHGYAVAQHLESGGLGRVKGGTLYPLLTRLETAGHLKSQWQAGEGGPGRKVFCLTTSGHDELDRRRDLWTSFTDVTGKLLWSQPQRYPATSQRRSS